MKMTRVSAGIISVIALLAVSQTAAYAGKAKPLALLLTALGFGVLTMTIEVNAADIKINGEIFEARVKLQAITCPNDACGEIENGEVPASIAPDKVIPLNEGKYRLHARGKTADGRIYAIIDIGQVDQKAIVLRKNPT